MNEGRNALRKKLVEECRNGKEVRRNEEMG
jgi:hypothetical protein